MNASSIAKKFGAPHYPGGKSSGPRGLANLTRARFGIAQVGRASEDAARRELLTKIVKSSVDDPLLTARSRTLGFRQGRQR